MRNPAFPHVRPSVRCSGVLLLALVMTPVLVAQLPSAVASRVKKIDAALAAAEKAVEANQIQTAQRKLTEAQRTRKEIQDRYAGKFDESDAEYKAMTDRLASVTAKVEAAVKQAGDAESAKGAAKQRHEKLCQEWIEKLKPFVDHKSDLYLRIGAELNSASPADQARSKAAFQKAKALLEEYRRVPFELDKIIELKNVESMLASSMKYYAEEEEAAAQEASCKEWVDLLAPYVDIGMHGDRYLVAAPTMDTREIARQQTLYEDAKAAFALYQKAEFPLGKTQRLQSLEEALAKKLEEFPKALARSQAMLSGDVATRLDQLIEVMDRDSGWKNDPGAKPHLIPEAEFVAIREAVERFAGTVAADDPGLGALRGKLDAIEKGNAERRTARASRTFQSPDGYPGADAQSLKDEARSVAEKARPKAEVHLVTIRSRDWAIEDVVEFTDTTRSALRHRVTRSVRAEVALKDADGGVWLVEVYLGQDQLPGGGWGPIKGHTTWTDAMAAGNLGKTAPAGKR